MSDNERKKSKVFLKKNKEKTTSQIDDFYEYDKIKSDVDSVDEEFFENVKSVDYDKLKKEHQKEENEKEQIQKDNSFTPNKENLDNIDENLKTKDNENNEDSKNNKENKVQNDYNSLDDDNDDDDDFGSLDDSSLKDDKKSDDKNNEKVDDKSNLHQDSIFNEFDFSKMANQNEEQTNNYKSLFENDEKPKEDSLQTTGIINSINSKSNKDDTLSSVFKDSDDDDDDDFGSVDDDEFTKPHDKINDENNFKTNGYVNVNQKSDYYKTDELEDDDKYYTDKKGKKKKVKSRFKSFLKFISLAILALLIMSVYFGLTHDLFKIDYIKITGNVINEKEIISAKSGVKIGDNIFLSRSGKIKKNLKEIPTIESVNVIKDYPNIIEIQVKENYISSYVNTSGGIITIDNFGKVKSTSADSNELTGIQLKGLKENNFKVGEAFSKDDKKVNLILELLTKSYYNNVSSIDFSNENEITFQLKNSIKVTFGDLQDYSKKLKILDVLIKKIQTDGIKASEIILNVGKNPIIVKK